MPRTRAHDRLPSVLWPLMFGNVVIGMGVMVVAGLLNEIRSALGVSITTAGHLISAAALLVSLGRPAGHAGGPNGHQTHRLPIERLRTAKAHRG